MSPTRSKSSVSDVVDTALSAPENHRLGGPVGKVTGVPRGDLETPALEGSPERAHLGWTDLVGQVLAERVDPLEGEVLVPVELADGFFGFPENVPIELD